MTAESCRQDAETSFTLIGGKEKKLRKTRKRQNRRKYCLCCAVLTVLGLIVLSVIVTVCYVDLLQPLRCYIAQRLNVDFSQCSQEGVLHSLETPVNISGLGTAVKFTKGSHNCNLTDDHNCTAAQSKTQVITDVRDLEYRLEAERTWEIAWEILQDDQGWSLDRGSSLSTGRVYSKSYKGLGRVSKLQGYVSCSPQELDIMLGVGIEDLPSWDPTVKQSKILHTVGSDVWIHYLVIKEVAGGVIASRDYVNIRHRKTRGNINMTSFSAITYPDMPPVSGLVRGINKPGGVLIRPVKGRPDKSLLEYTFSTDIGGWFPQWAVDQGIATALIDFLQYCRDNVQNMKRENRKYQ